MRPLFRNLFLLFGVVAIFSMLYGFGIDFGDMKEHLSRAGLYLPAVVCVWVLVYAFNARAFQLIVNSLRHEKHLPFRYAYKLTVSGFAFSYTTPFGFGGAPYRVMELSNYIGTARAMSATVLYSMMHILSHFIFWTTGAALLLAFHSDMLSPALWTMLSVYILVFCLVLYFFWYGYKNGMIVKLYSPLLRIPLLGRLAKKIYDKHGESMAQVDSHIAYLHSQPRAFYSSLTMEYVARLVNSLEFFFILRSLGVAVSIADSVLVLAFISLIGNMLFFFPMQLGAREGALAVIVRVLGFGTPSLGIFASFYTRVRELFWIFVGVILVKVGNKQIMKQKNLKH